MYEIWELYLERYSCYCVRTTVLTKFSCDLDLWPFDPKMYRYLPLTILHLCMKYESCTLKTSPVIVSEPKCWQSALMTLTFDLLTPKCIGIFLLPSCIYGWNMKAVRWKVVQLSCQNQRIDKVQLRPWPFDPKIYRYRPLAILHVCMKYKSCTLKTS